jgi:hypothetical protein
MKTHPYPVATFHDFGDARKLKDRLLRTGIPAIIHNEAKLERYWFLSKPLAAVHVEVAQAYYLQARQLIEQWSHAEGILENAVCCLECNSSRVEFPQMSRKSMLPVLMCHILSAMGLLRKKYYCLDCHYTWPQTPRTESTPWPLRIIRLEPWRLKKARVTRPV